MIPLAEINNDWTLFIDRDGVINHEKANDYIHTWDEFQFYDGVLEAFEIFAGIFKYIIVVTNQKGVGKGLTKEIDLQAIHQNMQLAIEKSNGRIDAIYYCADLSDDSPNRKPNPGMGLQALQHFGDIDINKSLMVGNTISDMKFGRNLGVYTIFLPTTRPEVSLVDNSIDASYPNLHAFAKALL
jgi:D-glycero-D-manno-heptose 1,7-bisphosphate phosphatase